MAEANAAKYRRRQLERGREVASRPRRDIPDGHKYWPSCETVLSTDAFGRNRSNRDGLTAYARSCHNRINRETKVRLYGGARHYHLKHRYGIGAVEVDSMVKQQGGVCAVCREGAPEHVDHDHATGKVRGIWCFNCNGGLGQFRDRIDILERAIDYLRSSSSWSSQAPDDSRPSSPLLERLHLQTFLPPPHPICFQVDGHHCPPVP